MPRQDLPLPSPLNPQPIAFADKNSSQKASSQQIQRRVFIAFILSEKEYFCEIKDALSIQKFSDLLHFFQIRICLFLSFSRTVPTRWIDISSMRSHVGDCISIFSSMGIAE